MAKKINTGLGKGLGALLPSIEYKDKGFKLNIEDDDSEKVGNVTLVDVTKIRHNPYQPRRDFNPQALEELKQSILSHGLMTPVTVRREVNGYELIAGERRLRASIAAGLTKIPVYIIEVESGAEMLEMALIENVQRENLNPIEIANGYQRLIDECNLTQEQVSVKVGKDRTTVTNFLRLLKLPQSVQESLRKHEISMGHARALLSLGSGEKIDYAWNEIIQKLLSVRSTEQLVRDIETGKIKFGTDNSKKTSKGTKSTVDADLQLMLDDISDKLMHRFGTQIKIHTKSNESGYIEFEFYSKDDFERLLDMFLEKD